MQTSAPRQDKLAKKLAEWQHDHQPHSSFYNSAESNESTKKRIKGSQDSVSDSHPEDNNESEMVPASPPATHRFSFRIMDKQKRSLSEMAKQEPRDLATAERTLDSVIFKNEAKIEEIKEHKSKLKREIKRLNDLVSNDNNEIRSYERMVMQQKTDREVLRKRAFGLKCR